MSGELDGGPLALPGVDGDTTVVGSGTLVCRIQVNAQDHTGTGPQVQGHGAGVVTAGPSQVSFSAGPSDSVYLCAEVVRDEDESVLYYDAAHDEWSTSSSVPCADGLSTGGPSGGDDLDPTLCPLLATAFPPSGDIPGVWDCPPYVGRSSGNGGGGNTQRDSHKPKPPLTPVYPRGTVKISSTIPGQVTFDYSNFDPLLAQWQCTEGTTSVTCTPPAAATGTRNVCGTVDVAALSQSAGAVTGDTRCPGTQNGATAVSSGPQTTATARTAAQNADFPWTCGATPAQTVGPWQVTCTVG
jgi:hypothetical protein